jgi:hypothetical protein
VAFADTFGYLKTPTRLQWMTFLRRGEKVTVGVDGWSPSRDLHNGVATYSESSLEATRSEFETMKANYDFSKGGGAVLPTPNSSDYIRLDRTLSIGSVLRSKKKEG